MRGLCSKVGTYRTYVFRIVVLVVHALPTVSLTVAMYKQQQQKTITNQHQRKGHNRDNRYLVHGKW